MCSRITLACSELPTELIVANDLHRYVHTRDGRPEVRFLYRYAVPVLRVWQQGQLEIIRLGARSGDSKELPCTGWT
jgi:hypothetical protein